MTLNIAFVAKLSDKKLHQKLKPLMALDTIGSIDLYRTEPFPDGEKLHWLKLPSFICRFKATAEILRFIILLFNGYKYDLFIGCFQEFHGVCAHVAARLWHKPVIQMVITSIEWNKERFLANYTMMHSDACGVRGEISAVSLKKLGYKKHIEAIHNLMEAPRKKIRPQESDSQKKFDFIIVANWAEEKDFPWMLKILSALKERHPAFKAAFCGDNLEKNMLSEIKLLKLEENILFCGRLDSDELNQRYSSSKCLLLTSNTEGLPQVALEAMSHSLPCALTDVGECSWLVRDGEEGFIAKHGDTEKMLSALTEIIENPANTLTMGKKARKRFDELNALFQEEEISRSWDKLINSVLNKEKTILS